MGLYAGKYQLTWHISGKVWDVWLGRIVALILVMTAMLGLYLPILRSAEPPEDEYSEVATFLVDNGYQTAYATFENANTLTSVSDGKVRVAAVASVKDMSACKWLSSSFWYMPEVLDKGRIAYVITESEMEDFGELLGQYEGEMQLEMQIGKFCIFSSAYNFSRVDAR